MSILRPTWSVFRVMGLTLMASTVALAACGESDKTKFKVAEIEDRVISLDYFERKMNTMDPRYLPANINSRAGREELLEIMINKELMALKAEQLGFAADGQADEQASMVSELKAVELMRGEIAAKARQVSEDEIFDYYENLARELKVSYMLFDLKADATDAKKLVEGGEEWQTVAKRLNAGAPGPQDNWTMTMQYGTVVDDLEDVVYSMAVNEICDPIDTVYGYFIVRVDGQEMVRVPPMDTLRDRIIQSVQKRKETLAVQQFIYGVFEDYDFKLNEEAVKIVFDALPPDLPLEPTPTETLPKLNLAPAYFDLELMSYAGEVWDLRRYYEFYNQSSIFGRPRRERTMGGLRRALREIVVREVMGRAAEDRGYTQRPEIRDEYKNRFEQAMVTRLHQEFVASQVLAQPQDVEDFWARNREAFNQPEQRRALALVADSEQKALEARVRAEDPNVDWKSLVAEYCVESDVKKSNGDVGAFTRDTGNTFGRIAWEMGNEGEVCYPREIRDGMWAIVKLERMIPAQNPELEDVRDRVARAAQAELEENLFQQRVEEWKATIFIRRYPENLDKAVYNPTPPGSSTISITPGV